MGLLSYILKFLREPSLEGIPLDSAARLSSHQAVLAHPKKALLGGVAEMRYNHTMSRIQRRVLWA